MRKGIHPNYELCTVTCACGNSFETRSVLKAIRLDICGVCHPFYTGKQKFVDTAGRVDMFRKRYGARTTAKDLVGSAQSDTAKSDTAKSETPTS